MSKKITIDAEKCRKDDLCVNICPGNYILRTGGDSLPAMAENIDEQCMSCGHCVMVCSTGALDHSDIRANDCELVDGTQKLMPNQTVRVLKSRRSIRNFKKKIVERETIESLVDLTKYAPSGCNTQMVHWTIIANKDRLDKLKKLCIDGLKHFAAQNSEANFLTVGYIHEIIAAWDRGEDQILWDAPVLLTASSPKDAPCENIDLIIAFSHLDIAAPSFKLGTCWTGTFSDMIHYWEPLRKEMNVESHPYFYSMILGYPKYRFHRYPKRNRPKIRWEM